MSFRYRSCSTPAVIQSASFIGSSTPAGAARDQPPSIRFAGTLGPSRPPSGETPRPLVISIRFSLHLALPALRLLFMKSQPEGEIYRWGRNFLLLRCGGVWKAREGG